MPRTVSSVRLLATAVVVAGLAACAGVPTSGSVHVGRPLPAAGGFDQPDLDHIIPSAPIAGQKPTSIVTGFLNALVDSAGNYGVARLYLAPGTPWRTATGTTLYDERSVVRRLDGRTVGVSLRRVGTIDLRGDFSVAPAVLHTHFTVVRSDGQWRISHLPTGILLSTSDAARTLQPATLYFLNHAQTRLVAEPVLVPPDEPGLATTLIHELIDGPSRTLAPAVTTAVPTGGELLGNVPIDSNGVAAVDLAISLQQVSASQLEQLSAQIVWTLRQLPGVTGVRLLVNGAPLTVTGVARVQSTGSWPQFDPAAPPTSRGALFTQDGRIAGVGATVPTSLTGRGLFAPSVSPDGATAAALSRVGGRTTLLVGPAAGTLQPRWTAASISAPSFDPQGDVVADVGIGVRSKLLEVPVEGPVHRVLVPSSLRRVAISAVAISRDGSRIAMVTGPPANQALAVGDLTTVHGVLSISSSTLVIPGRQDVEGVAWAGANEIVTTVRQSAHRREVVEAGVDGYQIHQLLQAGLPNDASEVAAAPDEPILAFAGGAVWSLSSSRWVSVRSGRDPSYAG
jgi:Lipoprotein LpqB beta-propeller domain/Sporulation and spore germination